MKHIVKKYPTEDTLAERRYIPESDDVPSGWEVMDESEYSEWEEQQLLTWTPPNIVKQETPRIKIEPENIYLSCLPEDEIEFSKLITLLQLGLSNSTFSPDTIIQIWDVNKIQHTIAISRFLEIMIQYGLYCYQLRN